MTRPESSVDPWSPSVEIFDSVYDGFADATLRIHDVSHRCFRYEHHLIANNSPRANTQQGVEHTYKLLDVGEGFKFHPLLPTWFADALFTPG